MIPRREILETIVAGTESQQEPGYTKEELDALDSVRDDIADLPEAARLQGGRNLLHQLWPDPLEHIRKTHLIKTKVIGEVALLKPNYAQRKFYDEVVKKSVDACRPIRAIILKARQLGFSTFIQSLFHYWLDTEPARNAMTASYDTDSTGELFQKTLFTRRNLWFPREARRDTRNTLELTNDSTLFCKTAGATTLGRGNTYHFLHASEIPMWADADEAFASVMQSVPQQQGTCVILESTARGATGPFYEQWTKAEREESAFIPFFAPWFWDPEYSLDFPSVGYGEKFAQSLNLEERRLIDYHKLSLQQLHWRRWCIANNCQGSTNKFKQEYPSTAKEAFLSTGAPVFDAVAVANLEHNARQPLWLGDINLLKPQQTNGSYEVQVYAQPAGRLRVWDHPVDKREYVIGADVAEGRTRDKTLSARRKLYSYSDYRPDYSAACVVELETGLHVASWHGHIDPHQYAAVLYALGLYYNRALLVVEINGPGIATIASLAETMQYPNLYRSRQYAVLERAELAQQYGWRTLPQTRELLMFRVSEALNEGNLFTRDSRLADELRTMERDDNGNPRARGHNKDDRVFALALALQGRYDVFGGNSERPGAGAQKVVTNPDQWVWKRLNQIQDRHARSSTRRGPVPPRDLGRGTGLRL